MKTCLLAASIAPPPKLFQEHASKGDEGSKSVGPRSHKGCFTLKRGSFDGKRDELPHGSSVALGLWFQIGDSRWLALYKDAGDGVQIPPSSPFPMGLVFECLSARGDEVDTPHIRSKTPTTFPHNANCCSNGQFNDDSYLSLTLMTSLGVPTATARPKGGWQQAVHHHRHHTGESQNAAAKIFENYDGSLPRSSFDELATKQPDRQDDARRNIRMHDVSSVSTQSPHRTNLWIGADTSFHIHRGLLPEGNFEDVQIAAPEPGTGLRNDKDESAAPASQNNEDSYGGGSQVKGGKGLRIKKIKRGYS